MDPYLQIEMKNFKFLTSVINQGGKNPVWNEYVQIDVKSLSDEMNFSCFDKDLIYDDLIGSTKISVKDLLELEDEDEGINLPIHHKYK